MGVLLLLFCGSEIARDACGSLACQRWRPASPPIPFRLHPIPVGAWLASDGDLPAAPCFADCTQSL